MDTKKLEELKAGYEWRNGIIVSPGKMECETLKTLYYYDAMLNGDGCVIEISTDEREYFGFPSCYNYVYVAESNDGFVSLEFYATAEEADARESEEDYTEED